MTRAPAWAYGALGLPLAFAALPIYVHVPRYYAETAGIELALLGAIPTLMGCLTHYGNGPAPLYFGAGYVEMKAWWRKSSRWVISGRRARYSRWPYRRKV